MSGPLVTPGRPGRRVIVRQRRVELPPFTNCRIVVAVQGLFFGGLSVPDRDRLVRVLRKATGVPEIGLGGAQGTTAADLLRAVGTVLPWVTMTAGLMSDGDILGGLARGETHVAVAVPRYNGLPGNLARWSPRFDGGHMIGILDARGIAGPYPEVLWSDPLAIAPAGAEWVSWTKVRPHLSQAGGRVFATVTQRGAAMSTSIVLKRAYVTGTTARIPKGAAAFAYDPEDMAFVETKGPATALKALVDTLVAVDQQPRGPQRPRGQFVRIVNGPLAGRYARLGDVTLVEPSLPDPTDVEAIKAAAYAEGKADGIAETEDRYDLVEEPLYRQAVPA